MMKALLWTLAILCSSTVYAGQVTVPNTFTAGTKAKAAEVNANFITLEQGVNDNNTRIQNNAASISSNQTTITTISSSVSSVAATSSTNSASIQTNATGVSTNQTAIQTLSTDVSTAAASATTNTTDIYTNTSMITAISGQVGNVNTSIQNNASAILGNALNVSNNANNISGNNAAIASLHLAIPTSYQVVDAYGTVLGDLLGASMNTMTFITPQGYITMVEKSGAYNGLVYGEPTYLTGTAPVDMPYDQYATPDCTGVPLPKLSKSYAQGTLFRHIVLDGGVPSPYTPTTSPVLFSETLVYVPLNEPIVTINYSSDVIMYYDYATSLATATCRTTAILGGTKSITGYHYYPNDPVVTGIPNVIGFSLSIQKK